ncbi:hypothetical protein [Alteribacillus iranensis]|uniref:Uncharacterized protein n=1 Tax=Alteribacillus iranensis TaxID=930128 RepID=A0A1I2DNV9_9BACI|nr:hypothetical protein [Alteribacillus iranensis]SFE82215.1 hypothetical protein SAMN05192532_104199 [Alteribacillus iranensis]
MKLSIRDVLKDKGIIVKNNHLPVLEERWEGMELLRKEAEDANLDDYDIALRNIPGGDHIE